MIRLEHANLLVNDIQQSQAFLQTAFPHWQVRDEADYEWYGQPRHWLHLGDDYNYITLCNGAEGEVRDNKGKQPGLAHLGFEVSDIDALVARMTAAGYQDLYGGISQSEFRRNVYYLDPTGIEFEFVQYLSDIPSQRNKTE